MDAFMTLFTGERLLRLIAEWFHYFIAHSGRDKRCGKLESTPPEDRVELFICLSITLSFKWDILTWAGSDYKNK